MSRTYYILDSSEAGSINYDDVLETSADTLRWNLNNTKTFVKHLSFAATPPWLSGVTSYTQEEILAILNDPANGWIEEQP